MVDILDDSSDKDTFSQRSSKPEFVFESADIQSDRTYEDDLEECSLNSYGEIKKFLTEKGESISVGPTYHTQSTKGEPVTISVVFRTTLNRDIPVNKILYVALDKQGKLLGHRTTYLDERDDFFIGTGDVNIVKRNSGILIPIELANEDFLTRYAREKDKDITYQVTNGNFNYLKDIKEKYSAIVSTYEDTADWRRKKEYLEKEIQRTEQEQIRWLKVWGTNGKLGFDANGIKVYEAAYDPRDEPPSISSIRDIDFVREEQHGIVHASITSVTLSQESLDHRKDIEIQKLQNLVNHP